MTSLYKRATPPMARILRAIEGAIKNVSDAHRIPFDPRYARSVAKRATGTLTAQWPEVLAARKAPSGWVDVGQLSEPAQSADGHPAIRLRSAQVTKRAKRGRSELTRPSPLRQLERKLFSQMRAIKLSGNVERAEAFIYVLREIAKLKASELPNPTPEGT